MTNEQIKQLAECYLTFAEALDECIFDVRKKQNTLQEQLISIQLNNRTNDLLELEVKNSLRAQKEYINNFDTYKFISVIMAKFKKVVLELSPGEMVLYDNYIKESSYRPITCKEIKIWWDYSENLNFIKEILK